MIKDPKRFYLTRAALSARNAGIPHGEHWRQAMDGLVHWHSFYGRCLGWASWIPVGNTGTVDRFPMHFHVGPGVDSIGVVTWVMPPKSAPAGAPSFTWQSLDGTTLVADTVYLPTAGVNTDSYAVAKRFIQHLTVTEDTTYDLFCEVANGLRIVGASVYERWDGKDPYTTWNESLGDDYGEVGDGAPIYDSHVSKSITLAEKLWARKSSPLFNYSAHRFDSTSGQIRTTWTSYANAFDGTSTSVTATTLGCNAQTQYRGTRRQLTVPVRCAVLGKVNAGTGTFKCQDSSGIKGSELTWTETSYTWKTTTFNLTDQSGGHKVDFWSKVTSTNTFDIAAIKLDQYE